MDSFRYEVMDPDPEGGDSIILRIPFLTWREKMSNKEIKRKKVRVINPVNALVYRVLGYKVEVHGRGKNSVCRYFLITDQGG